MRPLKDKIISLENKLETIEKDYNILKKNHQNLTKRRYSHKFKSGKCLYILKDPRVQEHIKVGHTDNIELNRLRIYRTISPDIQVLFLVYLENNKFLENFIKLKFKNNLLYNNHEIFINIDPTEIIESIKEMINFCNLSATIENDLDKYNRVIYNYEEDEMMIDYTMQSSQNNKKRKLSE